MTVNRIELLEGMVAQNPGDSRTRYMLAMELVNSGSLDAAVQHFQAILSSAPDYIPTYFQCGQALEAAGKSEEARDVYQRGIEACARSGDEKTRRELEEARDNLG